MNLRIYKYPLVVTDVQTVLLPIGARVLSVQDQGSWDGALALWAVVDAHQQSVERKVYIVGTGNPLPEPVKRAYEDEFTRATADQPYYIGTVQQADGRLVWHVFVEGAR